MTMKALSFRTDERQIADIKKAASMFQMSVAGLIREAVREYIDSRSRERKSFSGGLRMWRKPRRKSQLRFSR